MAFDAPASAHRDPPRSRRARYQDPDAYDTRVTDDPDGRIRSADEEEVEMRIYLDGLWHRELDPDRTVCELVFPSVGQYRMASRYDGKRGTSSPTTTVLSVTTQRTGVHAFDYICKGFK